jgi:hypothetical protein
MSANPQREGMTSTSANLLELDLLGIEPDVTIMGKRLVGSDLDFRINV